MIRYLYEHNLQRILKSFCFNLYNSIDNQFQTYKTSKTQMLLKMLIIVLSLSRTCIVAGMAAISVLGKEDYWIWGPRTIDFGDYCTVSTGHFKAEGPWRKCFHGSQVAGSQVTRSKAKKVTGLKGHRVKRSWVKKVTGQKGHSQKGHKPKRS